MGFKTELKREMRNVIKDVGKEVDKTWKIHYEGHCIEIINKIKEETLIIDGKIVDQRKRKSIFSHILPYSTLSGWLERDNGTKHKVFVKIGGFTKLYCTVKIDNKTVFREAQKLTFLPWEHKEKIVPFIQQQIQTEQKIVNEMLPDDRYFYDEGESRLEPGLADRLTDDIPTPFYTKKLLKLFVEQMNQPNDKTRKATYEKIIFDNIASYGPQLIEQLEQAQLDESLIQHEAIWLLEHAAHREVVKFALTVLGFTNCDNVKELLYTIGLHEEFTAYVVFAFTNGTSNANEQIWQLAKSTHGWGKIAAVEQLEAASPEIKQWLLTKGCENSVTNESLAYTCAMKGELDIALYEDTISKELYDGASLMIQGLLEETAHEDIDDYPYAGAVLSRFVFHAHTHCHTLNDFYPLMKIGQFLHADEEIWEERFREQWKLHERTSIQERLQPIIEDPKWAQLSEEVLRQDYDERALAIARFYEMDVTAMLFKLLDRYPTKGELYLAIMDTNDRQQIIALSTFAETHLSLSNPANDEQDCLQYIVQDLHAHDGVGLRLIQAALESETESLQYQALTVLEEWTPSTWQQEPILAAIKKITRSSKDKVDRQLAKQLLTK